MSTHRTVMGGLAARGHAGVAHCSLDPCALCMEEPEFDKAGGLDRLVLQDLARQVVAVLIRTPLRRTTALSGDLLVVLGQGAVAALVGQAVGTELLGDTLADGAA